MWLGIYTHTSSDINILELPEVRMCPSRLKARECMGPLWPVSSASRWPCARSHSRTLESAPADARNLPSTEKHREYIGACANIRMTDGNLGSSLKRKNIFRMFENKVFGSKRGDIMKERRKTQ
jgi:hypothetical protein